MLIAIWSSVSLSNTALGSLLACSKTLTRVPVEQMDDQVLGFNGHADWKFENASLNIVE